MLKLQVFKIKPNLSVRDIAGTLSLFGGQWFKKCSCKQSKIQKKTTKTVKGFEQINYFIKGNLRFHNFPASCNKLNYWYVY